MKDKYDIVGKHFGRLEVLKEVERRNGGRYFLCRCSCANKTEKVIYGSSLINHKTKSCGCIAKEIASQKRENLVDQRFGRLLVLEYAYTKKNNVYWLCQCKCKSKPIIVAANSLKRGTTTSCGCYRKEKNIDLSIKGKTFNMLTAEYPTEKRDVNGQVVWHCTCSCGKSTPATSTQLKNNYKMSCGCIKTQSIRSGYEEVRIEGAFVPALTQKISKRNKSGVKGVHLDNRTGKWVAGIRIKNQVYRKGGFNTVEDAAQYRRDLEELYHQPYIEKMEEKKNETEG